MTFAIIMPVLNEAPIIHDALMRLQSLREAGARIVLADGGSTDDTGAIAAPLADAIIAAPRGRGAQMNAGAGAMDADVYVFLHADGALPEGALEAIKSGLAQTGRQWGRFDVRMARAHPLLSLVAALMNARSRLTGMATGDQAIFVTRHALAESGGFADIALMEDIAFCRTLRTFGPPLCLREKVTISPRRWEKHGILRTILMMWRLRLRYFFGADPADLARDYGYEPRDG